MFLKRIMDPEKIPERIKVSIPWLNEDYVRKHGWVPDKNREVDMNYDLCIQMGIPCKSLDKIIGFENMGAGFLPVRDIRCIKQGDVIIFHDYDEWGENGNYDSDKFQVVNENFYNSIKNNGWEVLHGIVSPCPK